MSGHQLEISTPSAHQLLMRRTLRGSRERVLAFWTSPREIGQWLPHTGHWQRARCNLDRRAGGVFLFEWSAQPRAVSEIGGVYREIMLPWPPADATSAAMQAIQGSVSLTQDAAHTVCAITLVYPSLVARQAAAASALCPGVANCLDLLDLALVRA